MTELAGAIFIALLIGLVIGWWAASRYAIRKRQADYDPFATPHGEA